MQNPDLWNRIATYPLPADSGGRSFEEQLRADQKIRPETARRGIEEYRRFLYLSALNEGRTVPSKAVDAVWHLHLSHTRDYWDRFVPEVLEGRPIHHTPGTPTGHRADYTRTQSRYLAEFGQLPPKGIWQTGGWIGHAVALIFITCWLAVWSLALGEPQAPQPFVWLGLATGAFVFMTIMAGLLGQFGIDVGFGVDIWSDSEGGRLRRWRRMW